MENNLIKDTEHGFMPNKSYATDLVQFMDVVIRAPNEGKAADFFYLTPQRPLTMTVKKDVGQVLKK
jgi:hypothetical protein